MGINPVSSLSNFVSSAVDTLSSVTGGESEAEAVPPPADTYDASELEGGIQPCCDVPQDLSQV